MMTIKVAKVGNPVREVALDTGATVADALSVSRCDATGFDIKVAGRIASRDTILRSGQTIMLVKKIKGGTI